MFNLNEYITVKQVSEFIKDITKFDTNGDIIKLFTEGYCYGFALMLKQQFKHGEIYWDVKQHHAIFKINENYYDVNGLYGESNNLRLVDVEIIERVNYDEKL